MAILPKGTAQRDSGLAPSSHSVAVPSNLLGGLLLFLSPSVFFFFLLLDSLVLGC